MAQRRHGDARRRAGIKNGGTWRYLENQAVDLHADHWRNDVMWKFEGRFVVGNFRLICEFPGLCSTDQPIVHMTLDIHKIEMAILGGCRVNPGSRKSTMPSNIEEKCPAMFNLVGQSAAFSNVCSGSGERSHFF
jgi:hypothetical protein